MTFSDHDERSFRQTASAVARHNNYLQGYTPDDVLYFIHCDAQMLVRESYDKGRNSYCSTRGYVLSTYTDFAGRTGCYASVCASLFDDKGTAQ